MRITTTGKISVCLSADEHQCAVPNISISYPLSHLTG